MSDYRIDLKVRNNTFLHRIEQAGYKTVGEFCRSNGLKGFTGRIGAVINMTLSPLRFNGTFSPYIERAAIALKCSPFDLFTDTQLNTVIKTNRRSLEVNEAEMRFMLEKQDSQKLLEDDIFIEQKNDAIEKYIGLLTSREQVIVNMRHGLGEFTREHTLDECGLKFDITRERVRQIYLKALRKLRHPRYADHIRDYLHDSTSPEA
jgi:RNA polymerase sigma factor (sigma-70 family)